MVLLEPVFSLLWFLERYVDSNADVDEDDDDVDDDDNNNNAKDTTG